MSDSLDTRLSLIGRLHDREDDEAWDEFIQVYQPLILAIVQRRGFQYADAVEVSQEVLIRVANSIANWNPDPSKGSFRGWLYRVTRNLSVDYLRRKVRVPLNDGGFDIEQLPCPTEDESREFRAEFERQLFAWASKKVQASVKPTTWQAFWQSTVEGQAIGDVATQLNVRKASVYLARSRVMTRIATLIRERMDETADE